MGRFVEKLKAKVRGTIDIDKLKSDGCKIGKNFHAQEGVIIDQGHCWLIEIGDNVTLAPRVHILAHDASTKIPLDYVAIKQTRIGNNVFIGAGSIVLPGTIIEDDVIIGAGSVVHGKITSGVWYGNPARFVQGYDEWVAKKQGEINISPVFDESYKIGNITTEMKREMIDKIINRGGYIK